MVFLLVFVCFNSTQDHILIVLVLYRAWLDHSSLDHKGFPGGSDGQESACNARDPGSIPGSGTSPGGGHGNPLQYSCLENPLIISDLDPHILSSFLSVSENPPKNTTGSSSVQFGRSVVSNSLRPHELQHARPACPSPTPRVYSNSCPLSQWCHPAISSSVVPFSSWPQSFPASGSLQMSQFFPSGGHRIGVSASASVLPMNPGLISFRMDWLDLLAVQGTCKSLLQHHSCINSSVLCFLYSQTLRKCDLGMCYVSDRFMITLC